MEEVFETEKELTLDPDGRPINCTLWHVPSCDKLLIISPSMGTSRHFYKHIARHFCSLGYTVISLDYAGMFHEGSHIIKDQEQIRMANFGKLDINEVIAYALKNYPEASLFFLGHSMAGQVFPLAPNNKHVKAVYLIASQNISTHLWNGFAKLYVWLFWNLIIPVMLKSLHYLPGFTFLGKKALHKNIAEDWAKCGKSRDGILSVVEGARELYQHTKMPVKFISIEGDDLLAPYESVKRLVESYGSPLKEHEHLSPADTGGRKMNHFDFYRKEFSFLWQKMHEWFMAQQDRHG